MPVYSRCNSLELSNTVSSGILSQSILCWMQIELVQSAAMHYFGSPGIPYCCACVHYWLICLPVHPPLLWGQVDWIFLPPFKNCHGNKICLFAPGFRYISIPSHSSSLYNMPRTAAWSLAEPQVSLLFVYCISSVSEGQCSKLLWPATRLRISLWMCLSRCPWEATTRMLTSAG